MDGMKGAAIRPGGPEKLTDEALDRGPQQQYARQPLRAGITYALVAAGIILILGFTGRMFARDIAIPDDGYYYLLIARNYVAQGSFTFDGINDTNGFHPLWMLALVALYKLGGVNMPPCSAVCSLRLLNLVLYLITLGSLVFCSYRLRFSAISYAFGFAFCAVSLASPFGMAFFEEGMESGQAVLILVWMYWALICDRKLLLALLAPMLFLTRLDTLPFVLIPVMGFVFLRREVDMSKKLLTACPLAVAFGVYALYNLLSWGHVVPISGCLKSSFPFPTVHLSFLTDPVMPLLYCHDTISALKGLYNPNILSITCLLVAGALMTVGYRNSEDEEYGKNLTILFLVVPCLLVLSLLVFQKWNKGVEYWYLALPFFSTVFLAGVGVSRFCLAHGVRSATWIRGLAISVVVVIVVFYVPSVPGGVNLIKGLAEGNFSDPACNGGLPRNLKLPHTLFGTTELWAGTDVGELSFWTGNRVINLDGLVNNFEYQQVLRDGRLADYLRRHKVRYLVVNVWSNKPRSWLRPNELMYESRVNPEAVHGGTYFHKLWIYSYLYNNRSDSIILSSAQEIFRGSVEEDGCSNLAVTVVFDLHRDALNFTSR